VPSRFEIPDGVRAAIEPLRGDGRTGTGSLVITERRTSVITRACAHLAAGTPHATYLRELLGSAKNLGAGMQRFASRRHQCGEKGGGPVPGHHQDIDFGEYVSARGPWLRKLGYLLSGDWHQADDLAQSTITKLYARWNKLDVHNLDGYACTTMVNTFLAERRSPWRQVLLRDDAEQAAPQVDLLEAILDMRQALALLPARQRATVVLRFYCDLTVEQTAAELGCSQGTVKSQTAGGLDALRRALASHRPVAPIGDAST